MWVLDLWMLCLYVERCFESLICWLDPCLSSLLVAFISLCFSLLEKHSFLKLNSFSTDPWQISFYRAFVSLFSTDLDGFSIHWDFWVSSWQILNSFFDPSSHFFEPSIWPIDSRQILDLSRCFCHQQILSTSTNSFLSRFSARQILIDTSIYWVAIFIYRLSAN